MCAASPARKSRPWRIGSATKLLSGATDFSSAGPVTSRAATAPGNRVLSSSQNRSSGQASGSVAAGTCT